jgi:hypothetical protein
VGQTTRGYPKALSNSSVKITSISRFGQIKNSLQRRSLIIGVINNFGFFIDELEKVDGKWLFKTRTYPYLYLDTDPFTRKGVALNADISFS